MEVHDITREPAMPSQTGGTGTSAFALRVWHLLALAAGSSASAAAAATKPRVSVVAVTFVGAAVASLAFQIAFRFDFAGCLRSIGAATARLGALVRERVFGDAAFYTAAVIMSLLVGYMVAQLD
jgi:hypothetical protein